LSTVDSQRIIDEDTPVNVNVPVLPVAQNGFTGPATVPATGFEIIIANGLDVTDGQIPSLITALKLVACVRLVNVKLVELFAIETIFAEKLSVELSQFVTEVEFPESTNVPPLEPEQKDEVGPEIVPMVGAEDTVIVATPELAAAQVPDCMIALKPVVEDKLVKLYKNEVLLIVEKFAKLSMELSHRTTDPTNPETVNVPEFAPLQMGL